MIVCNITGERYYGCTLKNVGTAIDKPNKIIERGNFDINLIKCRTNKPNLRAFRDNLIKHNNCNNKLANYNAIIDKKIYDSKESSELIKETYEFFNKYPIDGVEIIEISQC